MPPQLSEAEVAEGAYRPDSEYGVYTHQTATNPSSNNDNRIDVLLFDLDGTLYDNACGYEDEIHSNIFKFMVESKGGKFDAITTLQEAQTTWQPIFEKYNLTKRGLIGEGYFFDSKYYDTFIRKGASKYISADADLRSFLQSIPSRMKKVVFTNAPESSANEILELLGVRDLFDDVLGTDFMGSKYCKPEKEAFYKVLQHLKVTPAEYHRVCYFEDSFKNLKAGKMLGFRTVFVMSNTLVNEGSSTQELEAEQFDAIIHGKVGITLKEIMPELWES
ncbi:HAD-superfamily hydrolase [Nitzschia inconspicua]|uniref:HAD-superfamily hydrolase n=1 Tax=Nitzschia inconspicua TaxID=303405 RepID=A0A9K3LEQ7_9STRA|nr:HAD-superfamily hydrolase [Nitzschia inconspicua]KAG7359536.1 HAD-superfamily hydrolase [Nitzschia inconspicua]